MRTILYECPSCGREHALCYLTGKGGKRLGVNCDDAALLGRTKFVPIPAAVLEVSDLGEQDLAGIPEYATAPARALAAGRENIGLPLMHTQPGRAVERSGLPEPSRHDDARKTK
jgi:hypothetical protein